MQFAFLIHLLEQYLEGSELQAAPELAAGLHPGLAHSLPLDLIQAAGKCHLASWSTMCREHLGKIPMSPYTLMSGET